MNVDAHFYTSLNTLYINPYNKKIIEDISKFLPLFKSSKQGVYLAEVVLDRLLELQKYLNKKYKTNIDEVINKIIDYHNKVKEYIEKKYNYLYEHQKNILPKLLTFHSYGMFWDMGTGKTLTSLIYMKEASTLGYKFIVLVPNDILLRQWVVESVKWNIFDPKEWNIIHGDRVKRLIRWGNFKHYKYNITTIHQLVASAEDIISSDIFNPKIRKKKYDGIIPNSDVKYKYIIILDEASKVKNNNTKVYRAVMGLRRFAKGLIALTGTPYENNLKEMFNITRLIKPYFMTFSEFYSQHVRRVRWKVDYVNVDEFLNKVKSFTQVITKKDVLDLPPIRETWVNINTFSEEEAKKFKKEFGKYYKEQYLNALFERGEVEKGGSYLGFIQILRMLDSYYNNWKVTSSPYAEGFPFEKYSPTHEKIAWLKDFFETSQGKIVIVTYFRGTYEMLSTLLNNEKVKKEYNILNVYKVDKAGTKEGFNNILSFEKEEVKEGKTILLATSTIDYGVNLPSADYLINFDIHYNPARLRQRRDRVYRIGTKGTTFVYYLYGNLIEDSIYEIVMNKEEVIRYIEGSEISKGVLDNIFNEWKMAVAKEYNVNELLHTKSLNTEKVIKNN